MSIDLQADRLAMKQVAEMAGVHPNTVWRWCVLGVHGKKLESFRVGDRRFTTPAAFKRFIADLNLSDDGEPGSVSLPETPPRSPANSQAHATAG